MKAPTLADDIENTFERPTKYAYWVRITTWKASFAEVIKVDFEVRTEDDIDRLLQSAVASLSPSDSWKAQLMAWTPMPSLNVYKSSSR